MTGAFDGFGVENYRKILADPNFLNGLRNTALYVVFVVPVSTAISLGIASMLNANIRLKGLFQTCYFLPMVTSITAVGLVWKWMFNYDYGLINYCAVAVRGGGRELAERPAVQPGRPDSSTASGACCRSPTILLLVRLSRTSTGSITRPRGWTARPPARIFPPHHGAAAGARRMGLTLIVNAISASKVFYGAVPAVQRQPRLGLLAVYGGVLPVRHVLHKVGAGPRGGQRRRAVRHRA